MRKNITAVIAAFKQGRSKNVGPVSTDGDCIYSYNLRIAEMVPDSINGGWKLWVRENNGVSKTTTEHIKNVLSELSGYARKE